MIGSSYLIHNRCESYYKDVFAILLVLLQFNNTSILVKRCIAHESLMPCEKLQ
jgi:hypothetical protein